MTKVKHTSVLALKYMFVSGSKNTNDEKLMEQTSCLVKGLNS